MKIALAHHWIMSYRGGEKVIEQIAELFPGADLHVLTRDSQIDVPGFRNSVIHTSVLNQLPKIEKLYKHLLPLHPWAIRRMEVPSDVDVLISSDASLIKGISTSDSTKHICYCHSPPRYLWELGDQYKRTSLLARLALDRVADRLRKFDYESSQRVDHFIANSNFVADRIRKYYGRESTVVYPPVDTESFRPDRRREPFHLVLSELTPYKRVDVAVEAYSKLGKRLVVIGDGSERSRLESIADSNVEFLGRQSFTVVRDYFETCEAFVFPGIEDFGITPVEAQAAGAPVIAFRAGGALETVIEDRTGIFFDEQTPEALISAIEDFRPTTCNPNHCRANAEGFSFRNFHQRLVKSLADFGVQVATETVDRDLVAGLR